MSSHSSNDESAILQGIYIPPKPELISQINACNDDLNKIGEVISRDPGVGAGVIKTVNSPFFGLANKIISIPQATVILGAERVTNIVKTLLLRESMQHLNNKINMTLFWETSVSIANAASVICRQLSYTLVDEAYTLGLFHNCGIPVLAQKYAEYEKTLQAAYQRSDGLIKAEEFTHFGIHHAAAGYRIARVWNLPDDICLAIKHHHSIDTVLQDKSASDNLKRLLCILKMSEHIVKLPGKLANIEQDYEWQSISCKILGQMSLSEYEFDDLLDAVEYVLEEHH